MSEGNWVAVCDASELRPGSLRRVSVGGLAVVVACTRSGVFALDDACAHEGSPLSEGSLDGTTLTCAAHGWRFACASGACLTDGAHAQRRFDTRIRAGRLEILAPLAGQPAGAASAAPGAAAKKLSPVEVWKAEKHGLDVWPDVERHAAESTPMSKIDGADLERMKWYGYFPRKANDHGHYMCRVRLPGCSLSAEQARRLSYIAYESGYSFVDVTTRGNVQIQGLGVEALPRVRAELERMGLSAQQSGHDNIRNVTSHPWSGIDPEELIDTRPLARAIQDRIVGDRELSDIPRKLNVALLGAPRPEAHAWTQDISFVAARGDDEAIGFQLLLAGTQGKTPRLAWEVPVFVRPEEVVDVTVAVTRTFRDLGDRHARNKVRLRFLVERLGLEALLHEVEARLGYPLRRSEVPVSPPTSRETFTGWFAQRQQGLWALGVCAPLGRLTTYELEGLALVARRFGSDNLRTTWDQNLVIPDIPAAARREAEYAVAKHGLSFEPDPAGRNSVACTGKQFCSIAVTETKGYVYQLVEELRRRRVQLHDISLNVSGCPSSCAMSHTADIGLIGTKVRRRLRVLDAFDVYLGGGLAREVRMGILYEKSVPFDEVAGLIEDVITRFHQHRAEGQTFSEYWRERLGSHAAAPRDDELARWQCSQCGHLHVGEHPPAWCPRCAAVRSRFDPAPEGDSEPDAAEPAGDRREATQPATPPSQPVHQARTGRRIVVVGGGVAAHVAADAARAQDPDARITLVSDEERYYNRLNLTRFVAGEVERASLFDYDDGWYATRQVERLSGVAVVGADPMRKTLLLGEGRELTYDACILAHGSSAATPPFHRDLAGVQLLRTLADADAALAAARPGQRAVVVGGGVLGIEAALGLARRGTAVTIVEWQPRLMPRQLDDEAAGLLAARLSGSGIATLTGASVAALSGTERVVVLALQDGRTLEADLVVLSTGIRPNVEWVKRAGIRCARGVEVDDRLATSAPDVYAAGDVAEWRGEVVGLWTNAIEQAKVAGVNAAGGLAFFEGFVPATQLKCLDFAVLSIGHVLDDDPGEGITSSVERGGDSYRRVCLRRGVPVGAIMLGASAGWGELSGLVERGLALEQLQTKLLAGVG